MIDAWPYGALYVLEGLWQRLGMAGILADQLKGRNLDFPVERVLFAMVANRGLQALLVSCHAGHDGANAWSPILPDMPEPENPLKFWLSYFLVCQKWHIHVFHSLSDTYTESWHGTLPPNAAKERF